MKKYLLIALLLVFSVAIAGKVAVAKDDSVLEQRKAAALKAADEKKACLNAATDLAAVNACSQREMTAFNPMQQMEDDFAAHFKERKETVLKNMENNLKREQKEYDCAKGADDVAALKICSPSAIMMGNMVMQPPGMMMPPGGAAPMMPPPGAPAMSPAPMAPPVKK